MEEDTQYQCGKLLKVILIKKTVKQQRAYVGKPHYNLYFLDLTLMLLWLNMLIQNDAKDAEK